MVPARENPPQDGSAEQHTASFVMLELASAAHFAVVVFVFDDEHRLPGRPQYPGVGGEGGVGLSLIHVPICLRYS